MSHSQQFIDIEKDIPSSHLEGPQGGGAAPLDSQITGDTSHKNMDEAFKVLGDPNISHAVISDEEVRKLRRKIDWRILPLLWLILGVQFVDKVALGNAALFGLLQDLNLSITVSTNPPIQNTTRYSNVSMIVNVGIIVGTFAIGPLTQRYPTGKALATCTFFWGLCTALTPLCTNYQGLMVQRFFLGFAEGGAYPAILHILSMWYLKREQAFRMPAINSGTYSVGVIFNLIFYGATLIGDPEHAWKALFYFAGPITGALAIAMFFMVPDSPASCRWLTEREKYVAIERLRENQAGVINKQFKVKQAFSAFTDLKVLVILLMAFCSTSAAAAVGSFGGLVLKQLYGASARNTLLLNIPSYAIGAVTTLVGAYVALHFPNSRMLVQGAILTIIMTGCLLQWRIPLDNKKGLLAGVWLAAGYGGAYAQVVSTSLSNTAGSSKKSFVTAAVYSSAALSAIAGPFYFAGNQAPRYTLGFEVTTVILCIGIALSIIYAVLCILENRRRERLPPPEKDQAFDDLTDVQNKAFRYIY